MPIGLKSDGWRKRCVSGALAVIFFWCLSDAVWGGYEPARPSLSEKSAAKGNDSGRFAKSDGPEPLLHKGGGSHLFFSPSLLRFDLKQNLHAWPVLGSGVERSPPFDFI